MKKTTIFSLLGAILLVLFQINVFGVNLKEPNDTKAILSRAELVRIDEVFNIPNYIRFNSADRFPVTKAKESLSPIFKFGANDNIVPYNELKDDLGFKHTRYHQTFKGIEVEGSCLIIHEKDNEVVSVNGAFFPNLQVETIAKLSEQEALNHALKQANGTKYRWEYPEEEQLVKQEQNDSRATSYPKGKLVICAKDRNFIPDNFRLAYQFDIYVMEPELKRAYIFVDAINGEILQEQDLIHHANANGTAKTYYSGTQKIQTDSLASNSFRLRETTRGNGVITMNMRKGTSTAAAVDFTDTDNYWDNANANLDEVATDCHWGIQKTYDYFYNTHNRNSYNGNGAVLTSYVHYNNAWSNAAWTGSAMIYGDGNGTTYLPFVSLDITGHEVAHGVTQNTAGLVYSYESGALNESFSDIFGTTVEFYAKGTGANWIMGNEIFKNGTGAIRSMSDPKAFTDPNTYKGTYWYSGTADNGGVHTNSGVQNYWFYLLCVGKSGTNDIGNSYTVSAIGMQKAEKISYRSLSVYLTGNSQYADARFYAQVATSDLYGMCSNEYKQVTNAWYAVGVGAKFDSTLVPLSGTYTIGGSSPDFATFTAAVASLKKNGVCGGVIFKARNGTYTERVRIGTIQGVSATSQVIFTSESGDKSKVILTQPSSTSTATNYTLNLDSSIYINFKDITISRTGTNTYSTVILMGGNARYNSIQSCRIIGKYGASSTGTLNTDNCLIATNGSDVSKNTFDGNILKYGFFGIYISGTTSLYPDNNIITNNTIDSFGISGIFLSYGYNATINKNIIRAGTFSTSQSLAYAIRLDYPRNGLTVAYNKIQLITNASTARAFYINQYTPGTSYANIYNNFISQSGGAVSTSMRFLNCTYIIFAHNNLLNTTNLTSGAALNHESSTANNYIYYYNNNYINKGTGYALYDVTANTQFSDYNNFLTAGTNLIYDGGVNRTLATWRTAQSLDAKSLNIDPGYTSNSDLHQSSTLLRKAGLYISPINDDIDNDPRSTSTPDIGADEYAIPFVNDAGIIQASSQGTAMCPGTRSIRVSLRNFGKGALTSASIQWAINGVNQGTYAWTGNLASGNSVTNLNIGNYNFNPGNNQVKVWVSKTNGITDSLATNDTTIQAQVIDSLPKPNIISNANLCTGTSKLIGGASKTNYNYAWSSSPSGFSSSASNPSVSPLSNIKYYLNTTNTATSCTSKDSVTITVLPVNKPSVIGSNTACFNVVKGYKTAKHTGSSYKWTVTAGNIVSGGNSDSVNIRWNVAGAQQLKIVETSSNGCKDSATYNVQVDSAVTASFTVSNKCMLDSTRFINTSKNASSYTWKFNLLNHASTRNTGKKFLVNGNQSIRLIIQSAMGCIDSTTQTVKIDSLPVVNGGTDKFLCSGDSVNIGSVPYPGVNYSWISVPSGYTSTSPFPRVKPNATTVYVITGTIPATGCKKSDSVTVNITTPTKPNISGTNIVCYNSQHKYVTPFTNGNTYLWKVNGANIISGLNNDTVTIQWNSAGVKTITCIQTGGSGCKDSNTFQVTVDSAMQVSFTEQGHCVSDSIRFTSNTRNASTYTWKQKGIAFSSIQNPKYKFNLSGSYQIVLLTKSVLGCVDSATKLIQIDSVPTAIVVSNQTICNGKSINIGANPSNGVSYAWSSNPVGYTSIASNPLVSPSNTTVYKLQASYANGCSDNDSVTITVSQVIKPNLAGDTISCFDDIKRYTLNNFNSSNAYLWSYGTGKLISVSNNKDSSFVQWINAGKTSLQVSATNTDGCKDSSILNITVDNLVKAQIMNSKLCLNDSSTINGQTSQNAQNYQWSVNGVTTSNNLNFKYLFPNTGSYIIGLQISSALGCLDSVKKSVTVYPLPNPDFSFSNTIGKNEWNLLANDTILSSYAWDMGDTSTLISAFKHTYLYKNTAKHTARLTVTDSLGCATFKDTLLNPNLTVIVMDNNFEDYNVSVYPNPFQQKAMVVFTVNNNSSKVNLTLLDIQGKIMLNQNNLATTKGENRYIIDANELQLPKGTYFIKMMINNTISVKKVIKVE